MFSATSYQVPIVVVTEYTQMAASLFLILAQCEVRHRIFLSREGQDEQASIHIISLEGLESARTVQHIPAHAGTIFSKTICSPAIVETLLTHFRPGTFTFF